MADANQTSDYDSDVLFENSTLKYSSQSLDYGGNDSVWDGDVTSSSLIFDNGTLNETNYNSNITTWDYDSKDLLNLTVIQDCLGKACGQRFIDDVPIEAVAFLGAVAAFLVVLVIFFLYLNKSLCFSECGGFPCIDKPPAKKNKLGAAYQYNDETSSDSDDEIQQRYQASLVAKGSVHSARSGKSSKSRKSTKTTSAFDGNLKKEESASLAEKGENVTEVVSPPESAEEDGAPELALERADSGPLIDLDDTQTYENKAFTREPAEAGEMITEPSASGGSPSESTEALSVTGTTKMSSDEHLFDVSDLQTEPPLISKCGSIEVSFNYETAKGRMVITVHQAKEIPAKDRGGASNIQLRLMLLPTKKQKFKTKVKTGESPSFEETFVFTKIFPDDVQGMGVRFRLYGLERMRRERMIGETIVGFASMSLDQKQTHWVVLEPRSNLSSYSDVPAHQKLHSALLQLKMHGDSGFDVSSLSRSDSASSTQSLQHGGMPELLVGLAYNGTTGRLSVEVIKGSNFRNMAMNRAPDTYVKLTLMSPTGQELQRCKTSVRRGQPNPLFKETFMFQVALFQLPEVTLMVSVYNKKSMKKKEMIGWFSLGMNSSGEEEQSHWSDMRENKGDQVCRWHVLLES